MAEFFYQCLNYGIEFLKYIVIYRMAFEFEIRKKWVVLVADMMILLFAGLYYGVGPNNEAVSMLLYIVLFALYSLLTFHNTGKWYRGVAVYIWSFLTILLLDGIFYMFVLMMRINNPRVNNMISDLFTVTVLFFIFRIVRQKNPHALRKISPGYYVAFTVVGMANAIVLSFQFQYADQYNHIRWVFIIIFLGVILQMLMVLMLAVSRNLWREKEMMNSHYLAVQEEHYQYLENREEETRRFRHDMRGHLYMLEQFLRENKTEEAQAYIKTAFAVVDAAQTRVSVGNPIVDAILNQYLSMCESRQIDFEIRGHMPVACELPAYDLCTIFSNLLQNAVEAVEDCDEKKIFLQFRYDERNLYVRQENTYTELLREGGRLISTKGANRGYGTSNIERSVERYGGMVAHEISEEKFVVLLELPQLICAKAK